MSSKEYAEIDLKEIRRWLKHGDIKQLGTEHNLTPGYVSQILRGRRRNILLLESATAKAAANKARLTTMIENLKR